jgi:DNA-binding MarR family transcriptional regulator
VALVTERDIGRPGPGQTGDEASEQAADEEAADEGDEIDQIVAFWAHATPGLDTTAKALSLRLRRTAHLFDRALHRDLADLGVEVWEFEMLLALRRAPGMRHSAGELVREAQISSGAMTNRLVRLERHGWVRRTPGPTDRRQVWVTLTRAGQRRAAQLLAAKADTEQRFFAGVDHARLERMAADLRVLERSLRDGIGQDDGNAVATAAARLRPPGTTGR